MKLRTAAPCIKKCQVLLPMHCGVAKSAGGDENMCHENSLQGVLGDG